MHRRSALEVAIAGALAAWSMLSLAASIAAGADVANLTGGEGFFPADQLQYLAWVREASDSVLVSNLFDGIDTRPVFLHPLAAVGGALVRIGLDVRAIAMVWKALALVALLAGFRAWCRRALEETSSIALALALFMVLPAAPLSRWTLPETSSLRSELGAIAGETTASGWLWGYAPTAIAVGLMPMALLALIRVAETGEWSWRASAAAAAAGLAVSWLHPWQGVTLVLLATVIVALRPQSRVRTAAVVAAWASPLAYYLLLPLVSEPWRLAEAQNRVPRWSLLAVAAALLPVAVAASVGVQWRRGRLIDAVTAAWFPAALVTYALTPSFPLHALEGISLPLAVLLVTAAKTRRLHAVPAAMLFLALSVPGLVFLASEVVEASTDASALHALSEDEHDALQWLANQPEPGVVLAPARLGAAIPALTARETWVGHLSWTPDFASRAGRAEGLANADTGAESIASVVADADARFVVVPCGGAPLPASMIERSRSFGCVEVALVAAS